MAKDPLTTVAVHKAKEGDLRDGAGLSIKIRAGNTRVVHGSGEALIRTPLKELLARLSPERFWQVHRSIIVARQAIASALRQDARARRAPDGRAISRAFFEVSSDRPMTVLSTLLPVRHLYK